MSINRKGWTLDALLQPPDQGHPLAGALRADLKAAFPELDPQKILDRAGAELSGSSLDRFRDQGPALRMRSTSDGSKAERSGLPDEATTEGWFATLAFQVAEQGPLLQSLRADLRATFPELDPTETIAHARRTACKAKRKSFPTSGPALQIRSASTDRPAPGLGLAVTDCLPTGAHTEGWFASLAFRIARVRDEIRQLGLALLKPPLIRIRYLGWAINRWTRRMGGPEAIRGRIDEAILRMLDGADTFQCDQRFSPWFYRILNNAFAEWSRKHGGPQRELELLEGDDWHVPEPPTDPTSELTLEDFRDAARLELIQMGIRNPPEHLVERWDRYGRRCYGWGTGSRPASQEPRKRKDGLYVAYGSHIDCRQELAPGDPARDELSRVESSLKALIEHQEKKDQGEAVWPRSVDGAAGPVDELAQAQKRSWGLVKGRPCGDPVWNAARLVHFFSWHLKAAATLAAGLRYSEKRSDPALADLTGVLRTLDCLVSFRSGDAGTISERLAPFLPVVNTLPPGSQADSEGATLLLRSTLARVGTDLSVSDAKRIDEGLPEHDWTWWISRVTGDGRDSADALVRAFAGGKVNGTSTLDGP